MSAAVKGKYSILGWVEGPAAEAADLRGVANFLMDLYDDPAFCHELMGLLVDVGSSLLKHSWRRVQIHRDRRCDCKRGITQHL